MQQKQEALKWEDSPKDYEDKRKEIRMLISYNNISSLDEFTFMRFSVSAFNYSLCSSTSIIFRYRLVIIFQSIIDTHLTHCLREVSMYHSRYALYAITFSGYTRQDKTLFTLHLLWILSHFMIYMFQFKFFCFNVIYMINFNLFLHLYVYCIHLLLLYYI